MNYNIRRMIFLIIALIWAIVIFAFSAKPGDESENQSIKVGMTVCNIFVPGFDNLQEYEQVDMAKKIDYAILAGCVLGAVTPGFIRGKNGVTAICTAVIYAATDEIHQLFVSGRSGRITDVLIDGCGAVAGTLIILLISRIIVMCRKKKTNL